MNNEDFIAQLDKEIERDRLNMLTEGTTAILQESDNDEDDDKKHHIDKPEKMKSLDSDSKFGKNGISKEQKKMANKERRHKGVKKIKRLMHKMKEQKETEKNDELMYGYGNSLKSMLKTAAHFGVSYAALGPILGSIGFLASKQASMGKKLSDRKRLYDELKSDKAIVDEKINDLNKLQKLTHEQKEEKYALIKIQHKLNQELESLNNQMHKGVSA